MPRGTAELFLGVFILILALVAWRMTASLLGWFVLFAPGAGYVVWGLVRLMKT
jgi:hypothetical protein